MKKDILTLLDLTETEYQTLFTRAIELKQKYLAGERNTSLAGKTIGLIFDKASTRTRISFETAMVQLGGSPLFISSKDTQIARNEPVRDTARVLGRYLDALDACEASVAANVTRNILDRHLRPLFGPAS